MVYRRPATLNLEKVLLDPAAFFEQPEDVLTWPNIESHEKIEILCRWAYDAAELAVAEEEGMIGGEANNLGAVYAALHRATGGFDVEHSGPTKHASFCAL